MSLNSPGTSDEVGTNSEPPCVYGGCRTGVIVSLCVSDGGFMRGVPGIDFSLQQTRPVDVCNST